jgi:hypothetical protein
MPAQSLFLVKSDVSRISNFVVEPAGKDTAPPSHLQAKRQTSRLITLGSLSEAVVAQTTNDAATGSRFTDGD